MTVWALLELLLVIGSYVVTVGLAVLCIYGPYWLLTRTSQQLWGLIMLLFGVTMVTVMLWSIAPRRDRVTPPGPLLNASEHPRLMEQIEGIARCLKQPVPKEIYLVLQVNAWVSERGGAMGFRSERVMGLGLPLMQTLSISQFRAVLAHEFAHYYSGDTRFGPALYKARTAMIRAQKNLGSPPAILQALSRFAYARLAYVFVVTILAWYWKFFMRATQVVSRKREWRADELACEIEGPGALADGLTAVHGAAAMFPVFWNAEVAPMLDQDCRPPIADGFMRFVAAPEISRAMQELVENELRDGKASLYDSHPPLRERITAVRRTPVAEMIVDDSPAISLLNDVQSLELQLLRVAIPRFKEKEVRLVPWTDAGSAFWVPQWRVFVTEYSSLLDGITVAALPKTAKNLMQMGSRMRDPKGLLLTHQQRAARAQALLASALALALLNRGWNLHAQPGQYDLERDGKRLTPPKLIADLVHGDMNDEAWEKECQSMGIAEVRLDQPVAVLENQPPSYGSGEERL